MSILLPKSKFINKLPMKGARQLAETLLSQGFQPDQAASEVAEFLDQALDFKELVKGIPGVVLEAVDGLVFQAIAVGVVEAVQAARSKD